MQKLKKLYKNNYLIILFILILLGAGSYIVYQRYLAKDPEPVYTINVNLTEDQIKEYQNRISQNEEMLKLFPNNYQVFLDLGNIQREMGQMSAAIDYFKKAWQIIPSNSTPWLNIGNIYSRLGLYEKAEESYLKALNINKTYYKVYLDLAELYENFLTVKKSQVRTVYLDGLKNTNNNSQVFYAFTEFLIREKNYSEALLYLQAWLDKSVADERQHILDRIKQVEELQNPS